MMNPMQMFQMLRGAQNPQQMFQNMLKKAVDLYLAHVP